MARLNPPQVKLKPGLRIGYVPQCLHIGPTLPITVERFMRLDDRVGRQDWTTALDAAGVPGACCSSRCHNCRAAGSNVLLARALINRPEILLPD